MPPPTVLITGCSQGGIGDYLAQEFASRGYHVFASGRSPSKLQHFSALDLNIETLALDVTDPTSIANAVTHISSTTAGQLNMLINNAGADSIAPILDTPLSSIRSLYEVNVFGVVAVTQAFFPLLHAGGGGTVVNIGSIVGLGPIGPWQAFYASSKAALHSLGDSMRLEFAPLGVKVVTVVTGGVGSRLFENAAVNRVREGSWYYAAREVIEERLFLAGHRNMEGGEYARRVVEKLIRGEKKGKLKPWIWEGAFVWLIWAVWTFGWVGITDKGMGERAGLGKLRERTMEAEKGKIKSS